MSSTPKQDLRFIKNENLIQKTFREMIAETEYSRITIKELTERAQINRKTFYLHYPYKEALYDALMDELIGEIRQAFAPMELMPGESFEQYALRHTRLMGQAALSVKEQLKRVLAGDHNNVFFRKLLEVLRGTLMKSTELKFGFKAENDSKYRLICWYCASAIVGFLMGCYYDVDIPDEEALDILCELHIRPFIYGRKYIER